jgi:hypothetical protein
VVEEVVVAAPVAVAPVERKTSLPSPEVLYSPPPGDETEVLVEEMAAPESTEEEVLLSTDESSALVDGEDYRQGIDVSGDLVSLFLENDADEELMEAAAAPRKPERSGSTINRALAAAGAGWVLDRWDNEIEGRFLQLPPHQAGWFERMANEKKEVVIFSGQTPTLGDFAVAAATEQVKGSSRREITAYIRCLAGDEIVRLDFEQVKAKHGKSIWSAPRLYAQALSPVVSERSQNETVVLVQVPREHEAKAFQDLMTQEQQDRMRKYRFGVMRQKYGQVTEEEMLSNGSSEEFEEFLEWIGERVHLKSHKGFKGGLNAQHNDFSYYRSDGDMEIMWHVAPFLHSEEDGCLGKKRYIGNDCVVVVFQDSACSTPFPAGCIVSKFVHVVVVVRPRGRSTYRVCVQQRDTVAPFGPALPESASFVAGAGLSEFLISKCVLGEMAAFESSSFAPLRGQVKRRQLEGFRKSFAPGSPQKITALRMSDSKDMKK